MKKENTALVIGSGLGILVFGSLLFNVSKEYKEENPKPIEYQGQVDASGEPVDIGAIATIGQSFIQVMASYDQEQNQPIKLMSVNPVKNKWQAKYEVEQVFENDLSLVYYYTVDIDQGHVIRHNVSVSDRSRRLLLSNPEPDSIVEQKGFTIKGQVFDEQKQVILSVFDKETGAEILKDTINVNLDNDAVYSKIVTITDNLFGDYILQVSDGQSIVQTDIVITQSK